MKYQLYVGLLTEIPDYCEFSYYDSRKRRLFLLCNRKPDGKFQPVPKELYGSMTADEKRWFNESCATINSRWVAEHEEEAANTANAFLDLLAKELEKEAENINGTDENSSGGEAVSV